ncbi:hypothetical protein P3T76_013437 [Phytophthora citrophthora]|uniref:Uncharacterized protein n=1 Tax=Phytophthora citrophthora TaxID=4793 RepID=A0AAD9G3J0_9STRA|nr:hypothetical protein P3T76_013415 [Phytophthora citrophthora]KAK1931240.1 hypothetical protein P3T76_013429 [Phytophthora citrophthora]KAK1931248.1 hypothetical protein P3T76_013437 [Phytophthora citrophthora]
MTLYSPGSSDPVLEIAAGMQFKSYTNQDDDLSLTYKKQLVFESGHNPYAIHERKRIVALNWHRNLGYNSNNFLANEHLFSSRTTIS